MSLFKRLFGIRTASKESGDIKIEHDMDDIQKGYILDYDMRSWEVKDVAVYTWENGVKDYEYTLNDGKDELFLNYESADQKLSIYWEGKINEIWPTGKGLMRKGKDMIDEEVKYKGDTYYFLGEGAAKVKNSREQYYLQNWLFENASETQLLSFNLYDDRSMDAYIGMKIPSHAISNILKR